MKNSEHSKDYPAIVYQLRELLGTDVLLLGWPPRTKGTKKRWAKLDVGMMDDPEYLSTLGKGNIGVALGNKSGGLCTIDIDNDKAAEMFMGLNPEISRTLITKGSRGCNLWFRLIGNYPKLTSINRYGKPWGEFRSDGAQTIIHGMHPEGMVYTFITEVPPLEIAFSQIQWPRGITPFGNDTERTENTESSESPQSIEFSEIERDTRRGSTKDHLDLLRIESIDDAVNYSLPTEPHQNHSCLFDLARCVLALEQNRGEDFSESEKRKIFTKWFAKSKKFLRKELNKDDYFFEFLEAYDCAEFPLGFDPLEKAWELATKGKLPKETLQFESAELKKLVSWCYHLQQLSGDRPFFLSCRSVQLAFNHDTHVRGNKWLKGLVRAGVLKVVEQGGPKTNKATRFHYCKTQIQEHNPVPE